jgi:hypothetical protein
MWSDRFEGIVGVVQMTTDALSSNNKMGRYPQPPLPQRRFV